jgi:hypothetical protein
MSVPPEVYDAAPETISMALKGPHRSWDFISIEIERARFHELGERVSSVGFSLDDETRCHELLDELEVCAKSAGYADADNFRNLSSGKSDTEIEDSTDLLSLRYLLMNPDSSEYFGLVKESERLVQQAAATSEARTFVKFGLGDGATLGPIRARLLAAYEDGRNVALGPEAPAQLR